MKKKNLFALILSFMLLAILCSCAQQPSTFSGTGEKAVTIRVFHSDETVNTLNVTTVGETLEDVLLEHKIVENNQGPYGLYILTADGETVDENNQEWWCVTQSGESLATGCSDTPIADGDEFELTFTIGY